MPNRARNYMDRLLGRNEGNEGRDFTDGRRYGENQRFYDDPFNDSQSEWNQNHEFGPDREDMYGREERPNYNRNHRLQSSRTRPRDDEYRSDYERDYNVRRNPPTQDDYYAHRRFSSGRSPEYNIRENESFRNRGFDSNPGRGSFARGDFRDTDNGYHSMRREMNRQDNRQESRGFFGKGPKGWKRSDDRIKEEVSEALYRDYQVDASEIEIEVKEGIVTLSGTVDSREAKRSAEECIENLSGVVDVHNRIRIADQTNVSNLRTGSDTNEKRSLS